MKTIYILALAALSGCAPFHEPRAVTNARWCDGGRDAVITAVNERTSGQRPSIHQDWTNDRFVHETGDLVNPPHRAVRYWGWDHDPIGEQWAAKMWVFNQPAWKFLKVDARAMEREYVAECNAANKDVDLP